MSDAHTVTALDWADTWLARGGIMPCAPGCARACSEEAHGLSRVQLDPATMQTALLDCDACTPSPEDETEDDGSEDEGDDESADESDDDGSDDEGECEEVAASPVALVGGRLYVTLDYHTVCDLNVYSLGLATLALDRDAAPAASWPEARTDCDATEHPEWPDLRGALDAECTRTARGHFRGDCALCERAPTSVVPSLWNGALHFDGVNDDGGANGGSPHFRAAVPARAGNCPSSADPCGDPAAFASVLDALQGGDRYWVATDGSSALVVTTTTPGARATLRLFHAGVADATRVIDLPIWPDEVISVRFHPDVTPLARAIDQGLAPLRAPSSCAPDGMASAPPSASTTPSVLAAPCPLGERRSGRDCVPVPVSAEDASLEDTHGGSDWGNRCAVHLRAGELDAAEGSCARGLAMAERPATRGAILYNLGRIAEARGDHDTARRAYRASLEARPGNAATQAALDALAP